MKIGFIGAGKVGCAFGRYLKEHGFEIYGYFSKTFSSAEKASKFTDSKAVMDLGEITQNTDILFITTRDDAIYKVCDELVEKNLLHEGQILVHMSGASSSRILNRGKEKGCFIYSLHPLQSFADTKKAIEDLKDTVFSIEGDEEKFEVMKNILKKLGNTYFRLTSEQKSVYHAAACVVSNYLVTLMDYGLSLFQSIGIDEREGYKALYPLIEGTIKNIYDLGTKDALTGPITRGDAGTVRKHIESLKNNNLDLEFYRLMGLKTVQLAEKNDNNEKIEDVKNILKRGVQNVK